MSGCITMFCYFAVTLIENKCCWNFKVSKIVPLIWQVLLKNYFFSMLQCYAP